MPPCNSCITTTCHYQVNTLHFFHPIVLEACITSLDTSYGSQSRGSTTLYTNVAHITEEMIDQWIQAERNLITVNKLEGTSKCFMLEGISILGMAYRIAHLTKTILQSLFRMYSPAPGFEVFSSSLKGSKLFHCNVI